MGPDDTERLADVAHEDLIERRVEVLQQVEDPDSQVVVHAAVGERLRWELALGEAEIVGGDQRGGEETGEGRGGRDRQRDGRQPGREDLDLGSPARPMLHDQARPRERAKSPLAHVRGEEVQLRNFRELMHTSVAIEVLRIQLLEKPRRRDGAARPAECESPEEAERDQERDTPGDLVPGVGLDEGDDLRGRRLEVRLRAVVASPVQREVGPQDAAARDRDDVRHLAEQARITQEADDAKVK